MRLHCIEYEQRSKEQRKPGRRQGNEGSLQQLAAACLKDDNVCLLVVSVECGFILAFIRLVPRLMYHLRSSCIPFLIAVSYLVGSHPDNISLLSCTLEILFISSLLFFHFFLAFSSHANYVKKRQKKNQIPNQTKIPENPYVKYQQITETILLRQFCRYAQVMDSRVYIPSRNLQEARYCASTGAVLVESWHDKAILY